MGLMAGQAHLLRNPSAGELKLSTSQKKTHKGGLRELECFQCDEQRGCPALATFVQNIYGCEAELKV